MGEPTQHRVGTHGDVNVTSPSHPNGGYDATDSRRDSGAPQGWSSVDSHAGATSDTDFTSVTSRFPDGDGWKQT